VIHKLQRKFVTFLITILSSGKKGEKQRAITLLITEALSRPHWADERISCFSCPFFNYFHHFV